MFKKIVDLIKTKTDAFICDWKSIALSGLNYLLPLYMPILPEYDRFETILNFEGSKVLDLQFLHFLALLTFDLLNQYSAEPNNYINTHIL